MHTVGFDGPAESITLTHTARDRRRSRAARSSRRGGSWQARLVHHARRAGVSDAAWHCRSRSGERGARGEVRMRTPFTGVRHRARHAVHKSGELDEGRAAARPAADRRRHPFPRARRHDRREPDAHARRAGAHRRDLVDEANGKRADSRRRRRLQHEGSDPRWRDEMQKAGADGIPVGDAVLQQADAGRAVQHYRAIAEQHAAADRGLQRPGPHRRATSSLRRSSASRRFRTSSASRKPRAT